MADRLIHQPERPGNPYRLGRSVRHDPRSLRYTVQPAGVVKSASWERKIPVLDQGDLGSCTGNATVGVLGTEPFYSMLTPVQREALTESEAVRLYSLATHLDNFLGDWPPDDTGSSGLDVAKAAVEMGYLSGYQHITSIAAAQTAIQRSAFIVGTDWFDGMFDPTSAGEVRISGAVAGGHEYECHGYDATTDRWHFWNSWGAGWGKSGAMWMTGATFAELLARDGDATTFVPVTQPAPIPTPEPTAIAAAFTPEQFAAITAWADAPHMWRKATAAAKAWKAATR